MVYSRDAKPNYEPKGATPHRKDNTGDEVSAIPNEICGTKWSNGSKQKIQQKPLVYLLLESTLGWK